MLSIKSKRRIKALDSASSFIFIISALLFKVQVVIALPIAAVIVNFVALSLYGIAYGLWLVESLLRKDSRQLPNEWYGFASLNQQSLLTCAIGLVGTALGIAAIFFTVLIIPTCWLFAISNAIWLTGEYQKINISPEINQKTDPDYKYSKQTTYLNYAVIVTLISVVTAVIATVSFFFPPFLWVSLFVGPYLGGMVIKALIDVNVVHPITQQVVDKHSSSYRKINNITENKSEVGWALAQQTSESERVLSKAENPAFCEGRGSSAKSIPNCESEKNLLPSHILIFPPRKPNDRSSTKHFAKTI